MRNGFVVAGGSSGSGKTTLTIGLMSALQKRGIDVRAFKAGPDYIDPMFHKSVLNKPSYNLPLYMLEEDTIRALFEKHSRHLSYQIIEGVMGYLDGHNMSTPYGSTAHLANVIDMPVLLVIDASGMALTAVAMIKGLVDFYTPSPIRGVIFNKVNSNAHYEMLKTAIESQLGIKCYGYLPYQKHLSIESRHLGLLQAQEIEDLSSKIDYLNETLENTMDITGLINDFKYMKSHENLDEIINEGYHLNDSLKIAIARDDAFSFYYEDNLESLMHRGVEFIQFSPIRDSKLPVCDGVYLGGGYPEVFAKALSENTSMRFDFLDKLEKGLPVYAECGGLMYLAKEILQLDGTQYPMVGFFDAQSIMTHQLQHFGHVEAKLNFNGFEIDYKGHEFHKSVFIPQSHISTSIRVKKGSKEWACGYSKKNVLATYVHNHHYSNMNFEDFLVQLWSTRR